MKLITGVKHLKVGKYQKTKDNISFIIKYMGGRS